MRTPPMRSARSIIACLAPLLLTFITSACSLLSPNGDEQVQDELRQQMAAWSAQPLMSEYEFNEQVLCFCPEVRPVRVHVVSGTVVSARDRDTGAELPAASLSRLYSVEGLFSLIQGAIDREADRLTVTYHPTLHYPTLIDIDYIRNAVDDELRVVASDLTPSGFEGFGFRAGANPAVQAASP